MIESQKGSFVAFDKPHKRPHSDREYGVIPVHLEGSYIFGETA